MLTKFPKTAVIFGTFAGCEAVVCWRLDLARDCPVAERNSLRSLHGGTTVSDNFGHRACNSYCTDMRNQLFHSFSIVNGEMVSLNETDTCAGHRRRESSDFSRSLLYFRLSLRNSPIFSVFDEGQTLFWVSELSCLLALNPSA